jgi:hypothetical protein
VWCHVFPDQCRRLLPEVLINMFCSKFLCWFLTNSLWLMIENNSMICSFTLYELGMFKNF